MYFSLSPIWLEILSEFFVNIGAAWFGVVFIGPQLGALSSIGDVLVLTLKGGFGILSLILAKKFREEAKK